MRHFEKLGDLNEQEDVEKLLTSLMWMENSAGANVLAHTKFDCQFTEAHGLSPDCFVRTENRLQKD